MTKNAVSQPGIYTFDVRCYGFLWHVQCSLSGNIPEDFDVELLRVTVPDNTNLLPLLEGGMTLDAIPFGVLITSKIRELILENGGV